ncbi:MAG: hypothetical protein HY678_00830 [Chloroflexi bacterium]|nr:hypothetical protein [Chloroflexota bacterium]
MQFSHKSNDWCHICGEREADLADVSYPENAEHGGPDMKYVRICLRCGLRIAVVAAQLVTDPVPA